MRAVRLAAAARALKRASGAQAPFSLAFLTDRRRIANPEPVIAAMPAGSAVIYRDYDDPRRAAIARRYHSLCKGRGVLFLIAADPQLAANIGADGVHWPARWRRIQKTSGLITAAAHGAADLVRAAALGADVALLSPVFPTQSHPGAEPIGATRFSMLAARAPVPVLALGGVDETNAAGLKGANVAGIAAIGAFCAARGAEAPL